MESEKEIFNGKTLADLFQEIHKNSTETKQQVKVMIGELKPLIENIGDATLVIPMIKDYMDVGIRNDEHLLKLATIIQRIEAANAKGASGDDFDFAGLQDLLEESENQVDELKNSKDDKQGNE